MARGVGNIRFKSVHKALACLQIAVACGFEGRFGGVREFNVLFQPLVLGVHVTPVSIGVVGVMHWLAATALVLRLGCRVSKNALRRQATISPFCNRRW